MRIGFLKTYGVLPAVHDAGTPPAGYGNVAPRWGLQNHSFSPSPHTSGRAPPDGPAVSCIVTYRVRSDFAKYAFFMFFDFSPVLYQVRSNLHKRETKIDETHPARHAHFAPCRPPKAGATTFAAQVLALPAADAGMPKVVYTRDPHGRETRHDA